MTQVLNQSDNYLILSGHHAKRVISGLAQTAPSTRPRTATHRTVDARFSHRDLPALRSTKLSLRRWSGAWTKAIFVNNQANRRTPAAWICPECSLSKSHGVPRQFSQAAANAQRDLRDQCRTFAATRGSWVNDDGPYALHPRRSQGGRCHRRHDCELFSRGPLAGRSGGGAP
jgi:hypothetical protein